MLKSLPHQYQNMVHNIHKRLENRKIEDQLQFFCDQLVIDLDFPLAWIGLKEKDGRVKCAAKSGESVRYLDTAEIRWDQSKYGQGPVGQAIKSGSIQYLDVRGNRTILFPWLQMLKEIEINTLLSIPINCKNKETVGALTLYGKDIQVFSPEKRSILEDIVIQIALTIDIHRTEKALMVSQEMYKELCENMRDGVAIYQYDDNIGDFVFLHINKAAEEIEQIQNESIVGRPVCVVFPSVKDFGLFEVFKRVYDTGKPESHPVRQYQDERISGWRENYVYKLSSGEIVAIYRDITAHKKVEEEIWLQKERAQVTLKAIGDGVITTDINGNIEYLNPTAETLTGWKTTEARGLPLLTVFHIVNEITGGITEDPVAKCLALGRVVGLANHTVLIAKEGRKFPIEDSAAPIQDRAGNVVGAVLVFHDVTNKKEMVDRLNFLATHDMLTDLPNRFFFTQQLKRVLKTNRKTFAIFFIDIDRFKFVNDSYGHRIGDRLLKRVANRMKSQLGEEDILCRYGGDEFAILINSSVEYEKIIGMAFKIVTRCADRFSINGYELYISLSMGIAIYPENGEDANSLVKHADIAMYSAKKNGGNKFHIYVSEEDVKPFKNFSLLSKLKKALDNNEFQLYYQSQIDLNLGKVIGAEALIRWFSPSGMIGPMDFIPLAEETGLIVTIGEWVLQTACQQNKKWQEQGFEPFEISVNISAHQFYHPYFVKKIQEVLETTELDAQWLNLEITETVAMQDFEVAAKIISELSKMGVKITIDDFGTGYSSLNYLANLELNYLKLDKSLIENLHTHSKKGNVTKAIIHLAQSLDLKVVAEGVEKNEELQFLQALECDIVQGFLFSKPLPAEDAYQWLSKKVR